MIEKKARLRAFFLLVYQVIRDASCGSRAPANPEGN